MWEFVLYQNAPRPGNWQAEGLTEGEQLAALGNSELFPFRLLITFAATFPVNGDSLWVCDNMCQFSSSLHPAQRALSCCPVASQLGDSWPGKRNKYQIAQKQTARFCVLFAFVVSGSYLSSRAVASQVLSAYKGLTSVFGMGTGGTPWLNHRNGYGVFSTHLENCIAFQFASIKPSTY